MTREDAHLEVLLAGRVAVIESASETAHYPTLNREVFSGLELPWLRLEYYDESELAALLAEPLERRFAAVVFTAGAIALPRVRGLLEQHASVLSQALANGVGIVITATTLGGVPRFDLTFVPEGSQVSLVDTGMREMAGTLVTDLSDEIISADDGRRAVSALTLAAAHALGWTHSATLRRPDGQVETVGWRAQFGLGRVIISVLPFEWIRRDHMVERALTRATRSRGFLIVGEQAAPPWYLDVEPGQFLARIPSPPPPTRNLLEEFSHIRVCSDAHWSSIKGFARENLLARLENRGTVEFPTDGPAGTVYARLDGVPTYLTRLQQAQGKIIDRVDELSSSPTFHLLALALLAKAARAVVRGRLYVPDLLRLDAVSSVVVSAMTRRVRDGSVDGLLLPTANLLAACTICDIDDSAAVTMAAWIAMHAGEANDNARAQARWALWAAERDDLLDLIPEPLVEPDSLLGQLACQLDEDDLQPIQSYFGGDAPRGPHRLGPLSDLDRAILAYTHARWGDPLDPKPIWAALTTTRLNLATAVDNAENIEELCYRTAAQVLLDAHAPLTIHPNQAASPTPAVSPRAATDLLTQQAAAELGAYQERQAQQSLVRIARAARTMAGILGAAAILLGLVITTAPLWLPAPEHLDPQVRLTLCAGLFLLTSTIFTMSTATDIAQQVAPPWLSAIGRAARQLRR